MHHLTRCRRHIPETEICLCMADTSSVLSSCSHTLGFCVRPTTVFTVRWGTT